GGRRPARAGGLHGTSPVGFLSVEGVVAGYSAADEVLKGVDLDVERGEIVGVIGPNGAGKSTLLKVIAGVLAPSRGRVRLGGTSAGLAPLAAEGLFEAIRAINADGVAIVMVEQNALEALAIARRGYILVDGRNSRTGEAAALAGDPDVRRIFLGG